MPQIKPTEASSSLSDFKFSDDNEFFGIKETDITPIEKTIKEVKGTKTAEDDDTPADVTNLDDDEKTNEEEEQDASFFGIGEEEEEKEGKKEGKKEDKTKGKEKKTETPKKEPESVDEEDKEDESKEDKGDDEKTDDFYTTLVGEMKEKGIFQNVKLEEGEEVTEERFIELQDEEIESRVEETLQALFEGLDEDAKNFIQFKKNGGKTESYLSLVTNRFDIKDFDETDEKHQQAVLRYYLTAYEGLDKEDLEDRLDWLKETSKEKAYAKKYYQAIKAEEMEAEKELMEEQKKAVETKEQNAKAFNEGIKQVLQKTDKVGIFPITKADRTELETYITKPVVKVDKNRFVPQFQVELSRILKSQSEEDKQKLIMLAKLVKNNFDIQDLKTTTETEVTRKVKSKLKEAKQGVRMHSSGRNGQKSLSDYFS